MYFIRLAGWLWVYSMPAEKAKNDHFKALGKENTMYYVPLLVTITLLPKWVISLLWDMAHYEEEKVTSL